MYSNKLYAGAAFPALPVQSLDGDTADIGKPGGDTLIKYRTWEYQ